MATLAHDVCDVHGAFSLYIKTCWQSLYRVFPTRGMGESLTNQKFAHSPPPHQILILSRQKSCQPNKKNKNVIFSCSHCSCTIFVLISYSFDTQVMLIYSQNAVFSFAKCSNNQNHSHPLVKKSPLQENFQFATGGGFTPSSTPPFIIIWKILFIAAPYILLQYQVCI